MAFLKSWRTVVYVVVLLNNISGRQSYVVDDLVGMGRRYDGIGGLSGGSATSKLLIAYPDKQRDEVLDYLFKPNFAAALQILKVEIGGDAQASDATEASHMHVEWEENYKRGYEWWLMKEAKKRNPNIKLYGLPWAFPGWLGNGSQNPYYNRQKLADYIYKWIKGAQDYHGLNIDFIGIWNERHCDLEYVKVLRKKLDDNGYSHIRIVASDLTFSIVNDLWKDSELAAAVDFVGSVDFSSFKNGHVLRQTLDSNGFENTRIVAADEWWSETGPVFAQADVAAAVDVLGAHYPGVMSPDSAKLIGKQLWSSEDFSTYNDEIGGGCWARILNQNYVQGLMTSTISWNLIDSFFQGLPWDRTSLMTAREPWSGNYIVESPIWMSAHTTQFTEIGWMYLPHGHGVGMLDSGGSYVTLASPDLKDITIVVETMSHDHSVCIRPALPPYTVKPQNITFELDGTFAGITTLYLWQSVLKFEEGETPIHFQSLGPVPVQDGKVTISVGVDEVYTLTTLTTGSHGQHDTPPPSAPFPLPFTEDFEQYPLSAEPFILAPQQGSYDVVDVGGEHGKVMRQMVLQPPVAWCGETLLFNASLNLLGRFNWTDVDINVDVKIGATNGSNGIFVGVRIDNGGCTTYAAKGIFFFIFPNDNVFLLSNDIKGESTITAGREKSAIVSDWNKLTLSVRGQTAVGTCNGVVLFNTTIPANPTNGLVGVGTDVYGYADFDNIQLGNATGPSSSVNFRKQSGDDKSLYFVKEEHFKGN